MKTTNFEISKKLKEAGFEAESSFFWCRLDKDLIRIHISQSHSVPESIDKIKAYDLETILDALPAFIEHNNITYALWVWNNGIGYYPNYDKYSGEGVYNMENGIYEFGDDESLADTAGRLWLMLKEKGLI